MDFVFQIETYDIFETIIQEILSHLYHSKQSPSINIENKVFQDAKQEVRTIIYDCDFDVNKISDVLINTTSWNRDRIKYFLKLLEEQKTNLLCSALNHYNSMRGETIEDFNWGVKCVLGTSELKTLNYSLLQLSLSLLDVSGQSKEILFDMNKDMLSKLITNLENICT